jgi:hypothetical protein
MQPACLNACRLSGACALGTNLCLSLFRSLLASELISQLLCGKKRKVKSAAEKLRAA